MNEEIPFNREEYYGLQFRWYGFDNSNRIAQFLSGDLPIPKQLFSDELKYRELAKYFSDFNKTTNSNLIDTFARMKAKGNGDFQSSLQTAEKGLYAFHEFNIFDEGKIIEGYYLVATPEIPLTMAELPIEIQKLIEPYYFPMSFSKTRTINVTQFFQCD